MENRALWVGTMDANQRLMTDAKLLLITALSLLTHTLPVGAQAPSPAVQEAIAPATPSAPEWRSDVTIPSMGIAVTPANAGLSIGVGVRLAHVSGHGVRLDVGYSPLILDQEVYSRGVDLSYLYRFRLLGNDRVGLGLDLAAGLAFQELRYRHTIGFFMGPHYTPETEDVADGANMGGVVSVALDGRFYGFVIGVDVRAHGVYGLQAEPGDRPFHGDVSANFTIGFGVF